jgi:hypothetical protein
MWEKKNPQSVAKSLRIFQVAAISEDELNRRAIHFLAKILEVQLI